MVLDEVIMNEVPEMPLSADGKRMGLRGINSSQQSLWVANIFLPAL